VFNCATFSTGDINHAALYDFCGWQRGKAINEILSQGESTSKIPTTKADLLKFDSWNRRHFQLLFLNIKKLPSPCVLQPALLLFVFLFLPVLHWVKFLCFTVKGIIFGRLLAFGEESVCRGLCGGLLWCPRVVGFETLFWLVGELFPSLIVNL